MTVSDMQANGNLNQTNAPITIQQKQDEVPDLSQNYGGFFGKQMRSDSIAPPPIGGYAKLMRSDSIAPPPQNGVYNKVMRNDSIAPITIQSQQMRQYSIAPPQMPQMQGL